MEIKIAGKFAIRKKIGCGAFGEIYIGTNVETGEEVAVKLESIQSRTMQVLYEARVLKRLEGGKGMPKIHWYGTEGDYNVMIMQLLGPSLEELFNTCGRKFSLKTTLMIAEQLIDRLECIHSKCFIHRDIKPDNFLIGLDDFSSTIFAVDFGLAKHYRDPKTKVHIPYKDGKSLTGTARYASINTHAGIEQSRRDDVESICYVLLYFARGGLPWQGLTAKTRAGKYEKVMDSKKSCAVDVLCKGLPGEFQTMLKYARGLGFEEDPDYEQMRKLVKSIYRHNGLTNDGYFDWIGVPPGQKVSSLRSSQKTGDKSAAAISKTKYTSARYGKSEAAKKREQEEASKKAEQEAARKSKQKGDGDDDDKAENGNEKEDCKLL